MTETTYTTEADVGSDRLRGVRAIAEFLGEPYRRVAYLVEKGLVPTGREGTAIVASKARLRAWHREMTSGGTSQPQPAAQQA